MPSSISSRAERNLSATSWGYSRSADMSRMVGTALQHLRRRPLQCARWSKSLTDYGQIQLGEAKGQLRFLIRTDENSNQDKSFGIRVLVPVRRHWSLLISGAAPSEP